MGRQLLGNSSQFSLRRTSVLEASGHLGMVAVGADKILHFILAAMIALAVGGLAESSLVALAAGVVAGAGKEVFDLFFGGTVELLDFLAAGLGGLVVFILLKNRGM